MAKLHKVNKNGTLSVILPKDVTDKYWGEGDEVTVEGIGYDSILAYREKQSDIDLKTCLDLLEGAVLVNREQLKTGFILKGLKDMGNGVIKEDLTKYYGNNSITEEILRKKLKEFLVDILKRI